jgi:hypothetical protein
MGVLVVAAVAVGVAIPRLRRAPQDGTTVTYQVDEAHSVEVHSQKTPLRVSFRPDARYTKIAAAYAQDAVDLARNHYKITLDGSDESVQKVEFILADIHDTMPKNATDDQVSNFAKTFGSYVGEAYRRRHGGEWGVFTMDGQEMPGIRSTGHQFWPWDKVRKRIVNGSEDNVWDYYLMLTNQLGGGAASSGAMR